MLGNILNVARWISVTLRLAWGHVVLSTCPQGKRCHWYARISEREFCDANRISRTSTNLSLFSGLSLDYLSFSTQLAHGSVRKRPFEHVLVTLCAQGS